MLYIENPAGVGYSYASNYNDYYLHNDISQSEDVFAALQQWYQAFPAYLTNSLWVTGLSYGGVYAPYLAW
jgi:carboxypeptidase C (cathepsin A)